MNPFNSVLEQYFNAWNKAFKSREVNIIRSFMSKDFKGYWAHSGMIDPEQYSYDYDLQGVINQYETDTTKSFETLSISERKDGEQVLVLGTEKSIINGRIHQAKCMFIWRLESNEWKLLKEYIELEA